VRGLQPIECYVLRNSMPCDGAPAHQVAGPEIREVARTLYLRGLLGLEPCKSVPDATHVVTNATGRWLLTIQEQIDSGVLTP
jgi:hypothetical protein